MVTEQCGFLLIALNAADEELNPEGIFCETIAELYDLSLLPVDINSHFLLTGLTKNEDFQSSVVSYVSFDNGKPNFDWARIEREVGPIS